MRATARPRAAARQRGVALLIVLGALALIAVVATRFALRIDELRRQAVTLREQADQRLAARSALAVGLYLVATRPLGPAGFGPPLAPDLRADDRPYRAPGGGVLQVQDLRGLYPLNAADTEALRALLRPAGVDAATADQLADVLLDYTDTDRLKRLNGAERREYEALGLPPPRDEWLLTTNELGRMPGWRDRPEAVDAVRRIASVGRRPVLNANTAPLELLAALFPQATPEQLETLRAQRDRVPLIDPAAAQRLTGLPIAGDRWVLHVGPELAVTVSAAGSNRPLRYNLTLTPTGATAPWLISSVEWAPAPAARDLADRAVPVPLADADARRP